MRAWPGCRCGTFFYQKIFEPPFGHSLLSPESQKALLNLGARFFYVSFYPPIFLRVTPALRADHSSLGFFYATASLSLTLLSSCCTHRLLSKVSQPEGTTSPDFPKQSDFLISSGELVKDGEKNAPRFLLLLCLVE